MEVRERLDERTGPEVRELLGHGALRERLWDWQFGDDARGRPVVLVDPDGGVIGYNAVMPVRVRFDGAERPAAWSCDYHVAAAARGRGVGRRVKEALHERHPLLMTFGVSDAAARVLPRLGWRPDSTVLVYRHSRRPAGMRGRLRALAAWATARHHGQRYRSGDLAPDCAVYSTMHLPGGGLLDALWERVGGSWPRIVVRDARYLAWRYEAFPLDGYRFLVLEDGAGLRGLAVFRADEARSRLVDLVIEREDEVGRRLLVRAWLAQVPDARHLQVVTSDAALGRVLRGEGFLPARQEARFFVRAPTLDARPERDWFVMGGDSDGEFLQTGRESGAAQASPPVAATGRRGRPAVRVASEGEVFGDPDAWDALLAESDADPLFLGWPWQSAWWDTWKAPLGLEPLLICAEDAGRRVGLFPLYRRVLRRFGRDWLALQVVGNALRVAPTVRTEYVDLLAAPGCREAVEREVARFLRERLRWDVLAVSDHTGAPLLAALDEAPGVERFLERPDEGAVIDCDGLFEAWLAGLGRGTRLRVFNRHRYLEARGSLVVRAEPDPEAVLALLNAFHLPRWGKACFEGRSLAFHRSFLARLPGRGRLRASVLEVDGVPRSVLYDVQVGEKVYNLQAGFDDRFDRKVSLGMLHLGFAIEAAFRDPGVRSYDLLAGGGRSTYYKQSLGGRRVEFRSESVVRAQPLGLALRLRRLRRRLAGVEG